MLELLWPSSQDVTITLDQNNTKTPISNDSLLCIAVHFLAQFLPVFDLADLQAAMRPHRMWSLKSDGKIVSASVCLSFRTALNNSAGLLVSLLHDLKVSQCMKIRIASPLHRISARTHSYSHILTYLPHEAVAEVSKDKEPIRRECAEFNWFESQLMSDSNELRVK